MEYYITQPKDYWIASTAVNISLNALGEKNRIQGSVASGAVIMCFVEGIKAESEGGEPGNGDGLWYGANHDPKRWPLSVSPTYFNSDDRKYVYAAIPRSTSVGSQAVIVFPSEQLDIYGRAKRIQDETETYVQVGSEDYFYVYLQGIISVPYVNPHTYKEERTWEQEITDWGKLDTAQGLDEKLNNSDWFSYSQLTGVVTFLKEIVMREGSSFRNLILRNKALNGVATSATPEEFVDSEELVATPSYIQANYLRRNAEDTAQEQIGFLKGLWIKAQELYGISAEGVAKFKSLFAEDVNTKRVQANEMQSSNYSGDGINDTGWRLTNNHNGHSKLTVDELYVRMKAVFESLEIKKEMVTGGNQIFSRAANVICRTDYFDINDERIGYSEVEVPWMLRGLSMVLSKRILTGIYSKVSSVRVNISDTSQIAYIRCYFLAEEGGRKVNNLWSVTNGHDLARCQTFNLNRSERQTYVDGEDVKLGNVFWWRKVIAVSSNSSPVEIDGKKYHYFDVSNQSGGYMVGSDLPCAGDEVSQWGNDADESRMNLVTIEVDGGVAIKAYEGIYTFDMSKCWYGGNPCKMNLSPHNEYRFTGRLFKIETEYGVRPVPVDIDADWSAQTKSRAEYAETGISVGDLIVKNYYYDRVPHNGSLWLCLFSGNTYWARYAKYDNGVITYVTEDVFNTLTDSQKLYVKVDSRTGLDDNQVCRRQEYTPVEPGTNSAVWHQEVAKGQNGIDAQDVEWVYIRTKTNAAPVILSDNTYEDSNGNDYTHDGHLPHVSGNANIENNENAYECTAEPKGIDDTWKYEWEIKRSKGAASDGHRAWSYYQGTMTLHNNLSESSFIIDIDNNADQFGTDSTSKVLVEQKRSTTVSMYYGSQEQALTALTASLKYEDGTNVASGVASVTADNTTGVVEVTVKKDNTISHTEIVASITATCARGSKTITFPIQKVMSGAPGVNPVIYQLAPTQKAFAFGRDASNNLTPNSVSSKINVAKTEGNTTTILSTAQTGITYKWGFENENTATSAHSGLAIGTSIEVSNTDAASHTSVWVELSTGDRETLPITKDGLKGDDGLTPYIGSNGNWWIGTTDTGIKAEGDDGLTPYIGSNGNWWIGNTDTGVQAEAQSALHIDLSNQMDAVAMESDGKVTALTVIETDIALYYGTQQLTLSSLTNSTLPTGVTIQKNPVTGHIAVTIAKDIELTNDKLDITFTATSGSYLMTTVLTIQGYRKGADGKSPVIYQLLPSEVALKKDKTGTYTPATLTCGVTKRDGNSAPVAYTGDAVTIKMSVDGGAEQNYAAITTNTTKPNLRVTYKLYQGSTLIDVETVHVTEDGVDGTSPFFADIDNEMDSLACDSDGKTTAAYDTYIGVHVWHGSDEQDLTKLQTNSITGITITPDATNKRIRVQVASGTQIADVNTINITVASADSGDKTLHFVLNGVRPGANGQPATLYTLVPSVSSVTKKKDGTYSVQNVSCTRQKNVGGTITDNTTDGEIKYKLDGGTEQTYTNNTNIAVTNFTKSIQFIFRVGGVIVDTESIPMVEDGTNGINGTNTATCYIEQPNVLVPVDTDGKVNTDDGQAFVATVPFFVIAGGMALANYDCSMDEEGTTHYAAFGGAGIWNASTEIWSRTGTGISIEGAYLDGRGIVLPSGTTFAPSDVVITIPNGATLDEHKVRITVTAIDESENEYTVFGAIEIKGKKDGKNGENAVRCDVDNQHEDFLYNDAGTLIAPAGGVTTQARLYDGETEVTTRATWSIDSSTGATATISNASGTKGVLTVSGLTADSAVVRVKAQYNGGSYYTEFTANKTSQDKYDLVLSPNSISYNSDTYPHAGRAISLGATRTDLQGATTTLQFGSYNNKSKISSTTGKGYLRLFIYKKEAVAPGVYDYRPSQHTTSSFTVLSAYCQDRDSVRIVLRKYDNCETSDSDASHGRQVDYEDIPITKAENGGAGEDAVSVIITPASLIVNQNLDDTDNLSNLTQTFVVAVYKGNVAQTVNSISFVSEVASVQPTTYKGLFLNNSSQMVGAGTIAGNILTLKRINTYTEDDQTLYYDNLYADLTVNYGSSQTITARIHIYANLLGSWKEKVEADTQTAIAAGINYLYDPTNPNRVVKLTTYAEYVRSSTEAISTINKKIDNGKNLIPITEGWENYEGAEVEYDVSNFGVHDEGEDLYSPAIQMESGKHYCFSAYMSEASGTDAYGWFLCYGDSYTHLSDLYDSGFRRITLTKIPTDKITVGGRTYYRYYYHIYPTAALAGLYACINYADSARLYCPQFEEGEAPTNFAPTGIETSSQIKQTAESIDLSVVDVKRNLETAGVHLDGQNSVINLKAGKVNFVDPSGEPYQTPKIIVDPVTGALTAYSVHISGEINADSGTFKGRLVGATGTFSSGISSVDDFIQLTSSKIVDGVEWRGLAVMNRENNLLDLGDLATIGGRVYDNDRSFGRIVLAKRTISSSGGSTVVTTTIPITLNADDGSIEAKKVEAENVNADKAEFNSSLLVKGLAGNYVHIYNPTANTIIEPLSNTILVTVGDDFFLPTYTYLRNKLNINAFAFEMTIIANQDINGYNVKGRNNLVPASSDCPYLISNDGDVMSNFYMEEGDVLTLMIVSTGASYKAFIKSHRD